MILFYPGRDLSRKEEYERLFSGSGLKLLSQEQLPLTLRQIAGMPVAETADPDSQDSPFLFFIDEPKERLSAWQDALEQAGLEAHMAVKTDHNFDWSLQSLMEEVNKEALYFKKWNHLVELIETADPVRLKDDLSYQKAVMMCYSLLQEQEVPEKLLDMAIAMLEAARDSSL